MALGNKEALVLVPVLVLVHQCYCYIDGFPDGSVGKESACNEGYLGLIPELGRSLGGEYGNPLQGFLPSESPWTEETVL